MGVARDGSVCFVDLEKAFDMLPLEKLWVVFQECDVGCRLLLTVKFLHSYSEVCVCIGGAKSQPFTVSVWLLQGRVLSTLIIIFYMNWTGSNSRDNEVSLLEAAASTVCFYGRFGTAFSQQGLLYSLARYSVACDQAVKISTKHQSIMSPQTSRPVYAESKK